MNYPSEVNMSTHAEQFSAAGYFWVIIPDLSIEVPEI